MAAFDRTGLFSGLDFRVATFVTILCLSLSVESRSFLLRTLIDNHCFVRQANALMIRDLCCAWLF